jgi:hypothetical protein
VEGVDPAVLDGATGGHERLGRDLAPEGALALFDGVDAPIDVHLDRLEVEQTKEGVEGVRHLSIVALRPSGTFWKNPVDSGK